MSLVVTTPPQGPAAQPVAVDPHIQELEDTDEWEYEYSATETETCYVTLDLTTPNVEPRRRPNINPTRTDPKGRWKNHGIVSQRRDRPFSPKSYRYTEGGEDNITATPAADPGNSQQNDDDISPRGSPETMVSLKEEDEEDQGDEQGSPRKGTRPASDPVQILNLHSENPMVSYRGQVFSCEWASNSGTELLFMNHDDHSQLPILRSLPGDVDLLAASSCRIVPKAVTLEPKFNPRNRMASDLPRRTQVGSGGGNQPISIPVGPGASQRRRDQAKFLEGLMALKQERGEDDEITVIAQKRQLNNKWKISWEKKRHSERIKLSRFIKEKARAPSFWEEVEQAKRRLQEMDREDGTDDTRPPAMSGGYESMAYMRGRKRKAPPGTPDERTDGSGRVSVVNHDSASPASLQLASADAEEDLDGNMECQEYAEDQDFESAEDDQGLYADDDDDDDLEAELYY